MKYLLQLLIVLAIAFSLYSCEKVIELDVPESDPQLVVDAWYTDEDTAQFVKLSTTAPYFTNDETPRVTGAVVTLHTYENDALMASETLNEEPAMPGFYRFNAPAEVGKGYQLEVAAPGFDVVKSDVQLVLESPEIFDIYWEEDTPDFEDPLAIYRVYLSTFEFPGSEDYYRWFIYADSVYLNGPFNLYLQSDELVEGMTLPKFSVSSDRYPAGTHVRILQSRINKNAYDYLSLLRFQTAFIGTPFDTPPAPLVGNMKFQNSDGYAIGFFGASAIQEASVVAGQ